MSKSLDSSIFEKEDNEISNNNVVIEIHNTVLILLNTEITNILYFHFGKVINSDLDNNKKDSHVLYVSYSTSSITEMQIIVPKELVFYLPKYMNYLDIISTYPVYSIASALLNTIKNDDRITIDVTNNNIALAMIQVASEKEALVTYLARTKSQFDYFSKTSITACIDIGKFKSVEINHQQLNNDFFISDKIDCFTIEYAKYLGNDSVFSYLSTEFSDNNPDIAIELIKCSNFQSIKSRLFCEKIYESLPHIEEYVHSGIYQKQEIKLYSIKAYNNLLRNFDLKNNYELPIINFNKVSFSNTYIEANFLDTTNTDYGLSMDEGLELFQTILLDPKPFYLTSILNIGNHFNTKVNNIDLSIHPKENRQLNSNNIKEKIKKIWCDVIGIDDIGDNENFFDLGGDSLSAIQVIYKIKVTLDLDISAHVILENPTLSRFFNHINCILQT